MRPIHCSFILFIINLQKTNHTTMKQLIIILIGISLLSCHRKMSPWPYDGDKQSVTIQTRTGNSGSFATLPLNCQLFVYNEATGQTEKHDATQEGSKNRYQVKLYPGTYTGYCVTNASEEIYWKYAETDMPENILLKSQQQGGSRDHLLGSCSMTVQEGEANTFTFDLERKVAQLLIVINNFPEGVEDLQIKVNNIPKTISLAGTYDSGTHTVTTSASPAVDGISTTQLLVFPPQSGKRSTLTLVSNACAYISDEYQINDIAANKITRIDITFQNLPEMDIAYFSTSVETWDKDTIKEEWETPGPQPFEPCQGTGDGNNLVDNPGFEEGIDATTGTEIPREWLLNSAGDNKKVELVSNHVYKGNYAAQLRGVTYMYQDIPVEGGKCYQLKMHVSAPNPEVKWRYWCTWMEGSTALSGFSDPIRSSSYQYQTEGYIDAMEGMIVRAPANATRIRMEIRTYSGTPLSGDGLYVDEISVERVR